MTHGELDLFLFGTIFMCCVMSVFNSIKNWKRGWPGMILSAGFLVFAVTVYLYKSEAPGIQVKISCVVLFLLLIADFFFRASATKVRPK